jgi:hypothetical protein
MDSFHAINDESLARLINQASRTVICVSPGVGLATTYALKRAIEHGKVSVTIIIDSDEDAYRIGYGEHKALALLHEVTNAQQFPLRRQPGLRIGVLVSDDQLVIWAPTARSVEPEREHEEPNAIVLRGSVVETVEAAVGADQSRVLPAQAEIGREALRPEHLKNAVESLKANPPAPFDLAQKTRVFSTRFQFVEFELRGAEWTERRVKLSSLFLNADLPEELQDILETQVHPFQSAADIAFDIPLLINGQPAYRKDGTRMLMAVKQADIAKEWSGIRDRYLRQIKGFGWLIQKDQLPRFRAEISHYEESLIAWVKAFREHVKAEEDKLIDSIVNSIATRLARSKKPNSNRGIDLEAEVRKGLQRMRVIEPKVRIVLKNVSWESSRDQEFTLALKRAFTADELKGWFEEFTAAKQQAP